MTDAPKIDAKAPDTSRDWPEWMDLGKQRCGWSNIAAEPGNMMRYIRADVAAAREAAAVERAFRDGLTYGAICEVTDQDEAWRTSQARARLEDGQAALDRLIAERVRAAYFAGHSTARNWHDDVLSVEDAFANFIAARGSKEGRDG